MKHLFCYWNSYQSSKEATMDSPRPSSPKRPRKHRLSSGASAGSGAGSQQQLVHATATNTTLEIIGTEKNENNKTFYRIKVLVKSSPEDPGQSWIVLRRFSAFYDLDGALRKRFPTLSDVLPECPKKSSSKADRPQLLNSYLLVLSQLEEPFTSEEVMRFLATR